MGVNSSFGMEFRFPVPEETLKSLVETMNARLKADITPEYQTTQGTHYPCLKIERSKNPPQLRVRTLQRAFDDFVHAGNWPYLRVIGEWLVDNLGEMADVSFGYDSQDIEDNDPWDKARKRNDEIYRLTQDSCWSPSEKDKHP